MSRYSTSALPDSYPGSAPNISPAIMRAYCVTVIYGPRITPNEIARALSDTKG